MEKYLCLGEISNQIMLVNLLNCNNNDVMPKKNETQNHLWVLSIKYKIHELLF